MRIMQKLTAVEDNTSEFFVRKLDMILWAFSKGKLLGYLTAYSYLLLISRLWMIPYSNLWIVPAKSYDYNMIIIFKNESTAVYPTAYSNFGTIGVFFFTKVKALKKW